MKLTEKDAGGLLHTNTLLMSQEEREIVDFWSGKDMKEFWRELVKQIASIENGSPRAVLADLDKFFKKVETKEVDGHQEYMRENFNAFWKPLSTDPSTSPCERAVIGMGAATIVAKHWSDNYSFQLERPYHTFYQLGVEMAHSARMSGINTGSEVIKGIDIGYKLANKIKKDGFKTNLEKRDEDEEAVSKSSK